MPPAFRWEIPFRGGPQCLSGGGCNSISIYLSIVALLEKVPPRWPMRSGASFRVKKGDRIFHSRGKGVERGVGTYVCDTPLAKSLLNAILDHCSLSKWSSSGEEPCSCDPPLARTIANGDGTQMNLREVGIVTST